MKSPVKSKQPSLAWMLRESKKLAKTIGVSKATIIDIYKSPLEVAKMMKGLVGIEAMVTQLTGKDESRCTAVRRSFGPSGTEIRGLVY